MKEITLKTKFGGHVIEARSDSFKGVIQLTSLIAECPKVCGKCSSSELSFHHRTAQSTNSSQVFDFYSIKCQNPECGAEYPLGQLQNEGEGSGLYPKGPWEYPQRGRQPAEPPVATSYQSAGDPY